MQSCSILALFAVFFRYRKSIRQNLSTQRLPAQTQTNHSLGIFRPTLAPIHYKERLSNAGRKSFDVVLMFKIVVLQTVYNLGIEQMEFQLRDRLFFRNFLDLAFVDTVPDAKTIWLFAEQLKKQGIE